MKKYRSMIVLLLFTTLLLSAIITSAVGGIEAIRRDNPVTNSPDVGNDPEQVDADLLEDFPDPAEGQDMIAISLLPQDNEGDYEVEIFAGNTELIDANISCNNMTMMGELISKDIEGFGYNYYVYESNGDFISTKMFCPQNAGMPEQEIFIFSTHKVSYNSKLPLVIYVPEGFEVRYKIWSAGETVFETEQIEGREPVSREDIYGKWVLVKDVDESTFVPNFNESQVTLKIQEDGRLLAHGCNGMTGVFEIKEDNEIAIAIYGSTLMACQRQEDLMDYDIEISEKLNKAERYEFTNKGALRIYYEGENYLEYELDTSDMK